MYFSELVTLIRALFSGERERESAVIGQSCLVIIMVWMDFAPRLLAPCVYVSYVRWLVWPALKKKRPCWSVKTKMEKKAGGLNLTMLTLPGITRARALFAILGLQHLFAIHKATTFRAVGPRRLLQRAGCISAPLKWEQGAEWDQRV